MAVRVYIADYILGGIMIAVTRYLLQGSNPAAGYGLAQADLERPSGLYFFLQALRAFLAVAVKLHSGLLVKRERIDERCARIIVPYQRRHIPVIDRTARAVDFNAQAAASIEGGIRRKLPAVHDIVQVAKCTQK